MSRKKQVPDPQRQYNRPKRQDRINGARKAVERMADVEAERLRDEAARLGTPSAKKAALEAEAQKVATRAREWNAAMGSRRNNEDSLVEVDVHAESLHVTVVPGGLAAGTMEATVYSTRGLPAPSWAPGHDGEGCAEPAAPTTATQRTAEAVLNQLLAAPGDEEKARDRLAWAAAVILGQREMPESTVIREMVRAVEDAALERVCQGAAGIPDWARREAPAAFKRVVDMGRYSSSMRIKYQANMDIMAMGGIAPAKKIEVTHKDALLDRLTDEELDRFARTGEWPARMVGAIDVTPDDE